MAAFEFFLDQIGNAFVVMQNFEVFPGLSLFWLLLVLLILNVVIILFVPTLPGVVQSHQREARYKKRHQEKEAARRNSRKGK